MGSFENTGVGYTRSDGKFADVEGFTWFTSLQFAAGYTVSSPVEIGKRAGMRAKLQITAKSGTNPTLDVTLQTSQDQVVWKTLGTYAQKKDVGLVMSAVTSTGTTPPTITLTGTLNYEMSLKVQCTDTTTNGAARGQWLGQFSIDGGVTWNTFTSAATVGVVDALQGDSGIVLNIATGNANVDNVWTATTIGIEEKVFMGCDRFIRYVANVGGSATPTMTATLSGEMI